MSNKSFRIQGGSQGQESVASGSANYLSMFQKDVNYVYPSGKNILRGRILPARDTSFTESDDAYKGSVVPYRDLACGILDKETLTPAFTPWYVFVRAYKFFGTSGDSFISPQTLKQATDNPMDWEDPVRDCFNYAQNHSDPSIKALTAKPTDKMGSSVIPLASDIALINMYLQDPKDNVWKVAIVPVTKTAINDLKDKLSRPTPMSLGEAYDPNFPDYLYGDITDAARGLLVSTAQITTSTGNKFNGFTIGTGAGRDLSGVQAFPVDEQTLYNRYDLQSADTLRILSYQELVEFMVSDGAIPLEVIKAACSEKANVPSKGAITQKTAAGPANPPAQQAPAGSLGPSTPQQAATTPPATPTTPPPVIPAAPKKEPVFPPEGWTQHPDNAQYYYKGSEVVTEEDLRKRAAARPAVAVPPAAPAATPASTPSQAAPVETPSAGSSLSAEEAAELDALQASMDSGDNLSAESLRRLVNLAQKQSK